MPALEELAAALDDVLGAAGTGATHGVRARGSGSVTRLALALEPWPGLGTWAAACDGVFLHRPWRSSEPLAPGMAVLASHEPFDIVLGFGPAGAHAQAAIGLSEATPFGAGLGVVGEVQPGLADRVRGAFGGWEDAAPGARAPAGGPRRVALAAALRPALVEEAAQLGAETYVTGSWRPGSRRALERCGVGWIAVGHRRSELWGLRTLAAELQRRLPALEVQMEDDAARG